MDIQDFSGTVYMTNGQQMSGDWRIDQTKSGTPVLTSTDLYTIVPFTSILYFQNAGPPEGSS